MTGKHDKLKFCALHGLVQLELLLEGDQICACTYVIHTYVCVICNEYPRAEAMLVGSLNRVKAGKDGESDAK